MDQTRLDAIRARCDAATPGPWNAGRGDMATIVDGYESKWIYAGENNKYLAVASGYEVNDWNEVMDNARFIAHSRADVPDLLAEVARLTAALNLLESDRDAERKIRLDAEAEADAWRRRAEAAKKALEALMESAYNGDRSMCYMCNKEAACDQAIKDTKYAECVPEWRGPEEDKPC